MSGVLPDDFFPKPEEAKDEWEVPDDLNQWRKYVYLATTNQYGDFPYSVYIHQSEEGWWYYSWTIDEDRPCTDHDHFMMRRAIVAATYVGDFRLESDMRWYKSMNDLLAAFRGNFQHVN